MVPFGNRYVSKLVFCIEPGMSDLKMPLVYSAWTSEQLPTGVDDG